MWVQTRDELAAYERSISYADWVTLAVKFNSQYLYADDRTTYTVLYVSVLFFSYYGKGSSDKDFRTHLTNSCIFWFAVAKLFTYIFFDVGASKVTQRTMCESYRVRKQLASSRKKLSAPLLSHSSREMPHVRVTGNTYKAQYRSS